MLFMYIHIIWLICNLDSLSMGAVNVASDRTHILQNQLLVAGISI